MFSRDTSPDAARVLVELLRKTTPGRKLTMVDEQFAFGRMLVLSGLRWRHPDASDEEIEAHYCRLTLGPELGERVLAARRRRRHPNDAAPIENAGAPD